MAKAIIVDDSKFMRKIIRDVLEESGHEIIAEAEDGGAGIDAYKKHRPDFITMDITMGGKSGLIAVQEIKKFDSLAKIIIISALNETLIKSSQEDVNPALFITKPFEKAVLAKAVNTMLKR